MNYAFRFLSVALLFAACQNQPATPVPSTPATGESAISSHKYWIAKPFNDALFAAKVIDTLAYLQCQEIVFTTKDSLFFTSCMVDAGKGWYKALSPTQLEIRLEGFDNPIKATLDEKTGVLHLDCPKEMEGIMTDFVAQDAVNTAQFEYLTLNLGRQKLAGNYTLLPAKGQMGTTALMELHADGTQVGLGDYSLYEPWISGMGSAVIFEPEMNVLFLLKKLGDEEPTTLGWQMNGDTLRLWDTKLTTKGDELPEYKPTKVRATYLKAK